MHVSTLSPSNTSATKWDYHLPFFFPELHISAFCDYPVFFLYSFLPLIICLKIGLTSCLIRWWHLLSLLWLLLLDLASSLIFPKSFHKLHDVSCCADSHVSVTIRPRNWSEFSQFPTYHTAALTDPPFGRVSHTSVAVSSFMYVLFNLPPTNSYLDCHCPFRRSSGSQCRVSFASEYNTMSRYLV